MSTLFIIIIHLSATVSENTVQQSVNSTLNNATEFSSDSDLRLFIDNLFCSSLTKYCNGPYYTPYSVGHMLCNHSNMSTTNGVISKSTLMNHLMIHKLVPVKKSSLYKLSNKASKNMIHEHATWTEISQHGQKGYLSSRDMMDLILHLKSRTSGGLAYSISEVRKEVEKKIRSVLQKKKLSRLLPMSIPVHTLNVYVSIIKAH